MPSSLQELTKQLSALNNPESPFVISVDGNVVTASWNIVDAKWYEFFAKTGMKETYRLVLTFDENQHQVSYQEQTGLVGWEAGIPKASFNVSKFKGKQLFSLKKGVAYGVKDNLSLGQTYKFDFDIRKIKNPVFQVIKDAGWTVKKSLIEKLFGQ